jgi:hypothetical protein
LLDERPMRFFLASLILVAAAGPAGAQPVVAEPIPTAEPDWSPYDDDGWPRGVSLEDVRHLRPCGPDEELPGPGEVIHCRPLVLPEPIQWSFGADWTTGIVAGDAPLTGGAHALGLQLDFGLSNRIQLGARYELIGFGLHDLDPDALDIGAGHRLFGQLRYRLFTDEVDRDAWAFTVGGGYAFQEAIIGGHAPAVRAAIGREVGMYLDDENAVTAALELAYERTFAEIRTEAVLASARLGFEVNIREPDNLGTADTPHSDRYYNGGDLYAGPVLGLGYTLGVPLGRHLELVGTGSFMFGHTDLRQQGYAGAQWALQAGPRLSAGWPSPAPLYAQLQAGPAWISAEPQREIITAADLEVGAALFAGCGGAIDLGLRFRGEVDGGVDLMSGTMLLRVVLGNARGRAGGRRCGGGGPPVAYMPTPPRVHQPIEPHRPPAAPTPAVQVPGQVDVDVDLDNDAGAGGTIAVEPPEPVVIEVELGAVAFGGLVEVSIDPRLLPLARLRGAGFVEIELSGPDGTLAGYQASLSALLDREGLAVDAWSFASSGGSVIRARITIWPPGSRPDL